MIVETVVFLAVALVTVVAFYGWKLPRAVRHDRAVTRLKEMTDAWETIQDKRMTRWDKHVRRKLKEHRKRQRQNRRKNR